MRVFRSLFLSLALLSNGLLALGAEEAQKFNYQASIRISSCSYTPSLTSSVERCNTLTQDCHQQSLLTQVCAINSFTRRFPDRNHRDIFLRELISNANDALEKLRLTSLTEPQVLSGAESMNITLKAYKDDTDGTARLVIRDTGIGMSPDELVANLGTLAKSGTSEFLARAESSSSSADTSGTGNLIGAFGLGFYSSFLVADKVYVSSLAAPSPANPEPRQYVFASSAEDSTFEVYPDPRGNTLGRGTEITLVLKGDAEEFLDTLKITELVNKHSSFATAFPIYLFTQRTEEIPVEDETVETEKTEEPRSDDEDDEEAVVDDLDDLEEENAIKTQSVIVDEWVHLNSQPPIWVR